MAKEVEHFMYNFVFFFARNDYDYAALGEENDHVRIYRGAFRGKKLLEMLFRYHWSYRINRIVNLPLKRIWFKKMYKQDFNNDLPLCFVYLGEGNSIRYDGGFCDYVRKMDPRNRQVVMHADLISKKVDYDYSLIKNKVDMCLTYDKKEAEHYGIQSFQGLAYHKLFLEQSSVEFEQDVYFLGAAKDRFSKIIDTYNYLIQNGIKCKFLIANVPEEKRILGEGIQYINHISYKENLRNVIHSKCLLEITQLGASNTSLRAREAIAYGRRLITDCGGIDDSWFHTGQIQHFSKSADIDVQQVLAPMDAESYPQKVNLDPAKRLFFIQTELSKKETEEQ